VTKDYQFVRDVSNLANLAKAPFTDFIVNKCTHDVNTENSNMGIPVPPLPIKVQTLSRETHRSQINTFFKVIKRRGFSESTLFLDCKAY
jgi:hypothetical protein